MPQTATLVEGESEADAAIRNFADTHGDFLDNLADGVVGIFRKASVGDGSTTTADLEYCFACQYAVSAALEHLDEATGVDEAIFVLHSACNDQPPIMEEACTEIIRLDAQIAQQMLVTQSAPLVCAAAGMCAR